MKIFKQKSGFTIIETLVAITILMISIAGPLTIAHKGLLAAIFTRDQVVASYLAQDIIEYLKNMRDNNILRGEADWLRGFGTCTESSPCKADTRAGDPTGTTNNMVANCDKSSATSCGLYLSSTGYGTTGSGTPIYTRYFYVIPKSGGAGAAGAGDEAQIVVVVNWKTGTMANQVLYESEIFNVPR